MRREDLSEEKLPVFLLELLDKQYESEYINRILVGYSIKRKVTLRVNTIKSTKSEVIEEFKKVGILYRLVPWYSDAFIVENVDEKKIQELELYQKGKIYLQSLSSMLPPLILKPKAGADILDMTAAPGGKTTQIAALSNNKAHITACEMNAIRIEKLKYNVEKQGAGCVYVLQIDSRKLDSCFSFDQILLDAPCSGSGVLSSLDEHINRNFSRNLIDKSVKAQRSLLMKAIDLLKKGQQMVYSTCSILSCENEEVIEYALSSRKVKIVPIDKTEYPLLPYLPTKLEGTVCIAPNEEYEGFYIAKLEKV